MVRQANALGDAVYAGEASRALVWRLRPRSQTQADIHGRYALERYRGVWIHEAELVVAIRQRALIIPAQPDIYRELAVYLDVILNVKRVILLGKKPVRIIRGETRAIGAEQKRCKAVAVAFASEGIRSVSESRIERELAARPARLKQGSLNHAQVHPDFNRMPADDFGQAGSEAVRGIRAIHQREELRAQ